MERAFEFVCKDDDPEWLNHRATMVTGSEIALVMGRAPKWFSTSREELIQQKRNPGTGGFQPTVRMVWGSHCEARNIADFQDFTGVRTRNVNALYRSTRTPRLGSTLDGFCRVPRKLKGDFYLFCASKRHADGLYAELEERAGTFGLLEAKQTSFLGDWGKAVPEYYELQVQQQLYVTGLDWCLVVAKVGAADMRAYFVDADPFMHDDMVEAVHEFWKEVAR